jgi:hypothetical protein
VDVIVDLKPLPFDPQIISQLQVGEAIHRKADARAKKVTTYRMGKRPVASVARLIRERTIKLYAVPPNAPAAEPHTVDHDAKSDEIPSERRKSSLRQQNQGKAARNAD